MGSRLLFKLQLYMYIYVHLKKGQDKNRHFKKTIKLGRGIQTGRGRDKRTFVFYSKTSLLLDLAQ